MFFKEPNTSNFTGTRNILNRDIEPAAEYQDLFKTLVELGNSQKQSQTIKLPEANSLNQAFGNQTDWECYKEVSIKLGMECFQSNEDIFVLFAMLSDCRRIIASRLNQQDRPEYHEMTFGKAMTVNPDAGASFTTIEPRDRYASFYSNLEKSYETALQEQTNCGYKIKGRDNNRIEYCIDDTLIYSIRDMRKSQTPHFDLIHCRTTPHNYNLISKKIESEFSNYLASKTENEVLESVSKLAYYFNLAMPLERGTASVVEMLTQVLLRNKGLNVEYKDEASVPMDLRAYFFNNEDKFIDHFKKSHVASQQQLSANLSTGIFKGKNKPCLIM